MVRSVNSDTLSTSSWSSEACSADSSPSIACRIQDLFSRICDLFSVSPSSPLGRGTFREKELPVLTFKEAFLPLKALKAERYLSLDAVREVLPEKVALEENGQLFYEHEKDPQKRFIGHLVYSEKARAVVFHPNELYERKCQKAFLQANQASFSLFHEEGPTNILSFTHQKTAFFVIEEEGHTKVLTARELLTKYEQSGKVTLRNKLFEHPELLEASLPQRSGSQTSLLFATFGSHCQQAARQVRFSEELSAVYFPDNQKAPRLFFLREEDQYRLLSLRQLLSVESRNLLNSSEEPKLTHATTLPSITDTVVETQLSKMKCALLKTSAYYEDRANNPEEGAKKDWKRMPWLKIGDETLYLSDYVDDDSANKEEKEALFIETVHFKITALIPNFQMLDEEKKACLYLHLQQNVLSASNEYFEQYSHPWFQNNGGDAHAPMYMWIQMPGGFFITLQKTGNEDDRFTLHIYSGEFYFDLDRAWIHTDLTGWDSKGERLDKLKVKTGKQLVLSFDIDLQKNPSEMILLKDIEYKRIHTPE